MLVFNVIGNYCYIIYDCLVWRILLVNCWSGVIILQEWTIEFPCPVVLINELLSGLLLVLPSNL